MNPTARNKYVDGDLEIAHRHRCDIIQLKYDGNWCQCVSISGHQSYYSDTNRLFHESFLPTVPDGTYIGEFMRGTQWSKDDSRHGNFYLFDVWSALGQPVLATYRQRYKLLGGLLSDAPPSWQRVKCYPVSQRLAIWNDFVLQQNWEGIVYRYSDGLLDYPIVREKHVFTLDGIVTALEKGKDDGKHSDRLGALVVLVTSTGQTTKIGNGFTDTERESILANPSLYLGRCVEFTANAVFTSGSTRHARFIRWRDDKFPTA